MGTSSGYLGHLVQSWEPLRSFLELLGSLLGASGASLGTAWELLGGCLGPRMAKEEHRMAEIRAKTLKP